MVVGFVSLVLAGAFRTALLICRVLWALVCKLVSNVLWRAVLLGQQKGRLDEPPIVGRFARASVISTRRKLRDKANYRAPFGCA